MSKHLLFTTLTLALWAAGCASDREFTDPNGTNGKKDTVDLNVKTFKSEVLDAQNRVALVDFWAPWCGPCRAVAPTVDVVAERYQGKVLVGKVNVDQEKDIATHFEIRGIPCLMVFKNGHAIDKIVGVASYAEISEMLDRHL